MCKPVILFGILFLLSSPIIYSQVSTNKYEQQIDALLLKNNPDYYKGLEKVLTKFERELVSLGYLKDGSYEEFKTLLKQKSREDKIIVSTSFDLDEAINKLGPGIISEIPSVEHSLISKQYFNSENSKYFILNHRISEQLRNNQKLNYPTLTDIYLKVFDENDFDLPLIKLKFYRLVNPNSELFFYVYKGKSIG